MEKAERSLLLEDTLEVIKQPTAGGLKQVDGPTLATAPLPSGCRATGYFPETTTLAVCPTGLGGVGAQMLLQTTWAEITDSLLGRMAKLRLLKFIIQ